MRDPSGDQAAVNPYASVKGRGANVRAVRRDHAYVCTTAVHDHRPIGRPGHRLHPDILRVHRLVVRRKPIAAGWIDCRDALLVGAVGRNRKQAQLVAVRLGKCDPLAVRRPCGPTIGRREKLEIRTVDGDRKDRRSTRFGSFEPDKRDSPAIRRPDRRLPFGRLTRQHIARD